MVYLETDQDLAQYRHDTAKDDMGNPLDRQLRVNYLTLEELDTKGIVSANLRCGGDEPLMRVVKEYKVRSEFVVVFRSKACGGVECCKAKLVPDYHTCKRQCAQFEKPDDALVINLDRE